MSELARKLEDEYIQRLEAERKRALDELRAKQIAETEKQQLKELHYMHCPKCGMPLREIDYRGIKIDKCFSCQGTWLDAGEIEAIAALENSSLSRLLRVFGS